MDPFAVQPDNGATNHPVLPLPENMQRPSLLRKHKTAAKPKDRANLLKRCIPF